MTRVLKRWIQAKSVYHTKWGEDVSNCYKGVDILKSLVLRLLNVYRMYPLDTGYVNLTSVIAG